MLLEEIQLKEQMEDTLGKEDLEKELDLAFARKGGENADLSKAFATPASKATAAEAPEIQAATTIAREVKEPDVQDAEMA